MTDAEPDADWNWWCDHCQRGKQGYPSLPDDVEVTDLGGELICEQCNAPTITAVAQYNCPDELVWMYDETVWLYYQNEAPPPTETLHGTEVRKQDERVFEDSVNVPTATSVIEEQAEEDTVTLVPPFGE